MADTKRVCCMLTPERHAAFKIACIKLGTTMDRCIHDTVRETIVRASLMPDNSRLPQKENPDGTD